MDDHRYFYYVLIAIEGLNINNPLVIGVFEDRDEAYEERNRLQEGDYWSQYFVRTGVMIHKKEENQ